MAITAAERTQIIELTALMFNAAPGATYLAQIVAIFEANGHNLQSLANTLGGTSVYQALNPNFQTAAEFANDLLTPLGLQNDAIATTFITSRFNAGQSKASIVFQAFNALNGIAPTDAAQYQNAKTILTNKTTVAEYYSVTKEGLATDLPTLQTVIGGVTAAAASVTSAEAAIDQLVITGLAFNLTTGVDNIVGTSLNDTINGQVGGTATLTALDSINGGPGTDIFNINDVAGLGAALPGGISVNGVEVLNLASAGLVGTALTPFDTSGVAGLTNVNVTASTGADFVTAGAGQAVSVADTGGFVTVVGGTSQTVNTAGGVALSKATGNIVVNDAAQAAAATTIDGGVNVTLNASTKGAGTITIGGTTAPTGAVAVTENVTGNTGAPLTAGAISVKGGTTVTVTSNATQPVSATAAANQTTTQAAVTVTGTSATTGVTVNQTAAATAAATVIAVAATVESTVVQFGSLKAGDTLTFDGFTLVSAVDLTAKQVAATFANLPVGTLPGVSSGAVSGAGSDTVTFTANVAGNAVDLTAALVNTSGLSTASTVTITQGVDAVKAAGTGGIGNGTVTVADGGSSAVANVVLSNYAASTITSNALAFLGLSGKSGTLGITNTVQTTLDITANKLSGTNTITDVNGKYTTLKVHTTGADSTVANVVAGGVQAMTLDGTNALTLTSAAGLAALKTVTVSGAAGLSADVTAIASVTDVNASATSGNNSVKLDVTKATYEGGTGNDNVTIAAVPTKAISGGTGADTLTLNLTAATFSNPSGNTFISGFETLGLGAAAVGTYDATGFLHLTEGAVAGAVTYINAGAGVDLNITATPTAATTYTLKDATGTSDALTLNIKGSGAIAANTVTAAGVESVAITATDTASTAVAGGTADSVTLVATAATSITVSGNTTFTLLSANNKVTSVDASAMTGGLVYTAAGGVAETVKGGATANTLTASTGTLTDTLIGGAAADLLKGNAGLGTLTGGAGVDTFDVSTVNANVNSYTTLTDASVGDIIQLKDQGVETFTATKITLAPTAVFQDYANAVIAANPGAVNGGMGWFQFGGDTYIVESLHTGTDFQNGVDVVVKLLGIHDLSTASLLATGAGLPDLVLHS